MPHPKWPRAIQPKLHYFDLLRICCTTSCRTQHRRISRHLQYFEEQCLWHTNTQIQPYSVFSLRTALCKIVVVCYYHSTDKCTVKVIVFVHDKIRHFITQVYYYLRPLSRSNVNKGCLSNKSAFVTQHK